MVLKTREKLIEVARQLFAHKGVENTTMNDIAAASDKGRRTIYTYFKNKREIYNAVVERESDTIVLKLKEVADSSLPPQDKLRLGLRRRFETVMQLSARHDSLLTIFVRDVRRIDRIRRTVSDKEREILDAILDEGVRAGVFDPVQAKALPGMTSLLFRGVDFFTVKTDEDEKKKIEDTISDTIDFITQGMLLR